MKKEISVAVGFLIRLIEKSHGANNHGGSGESKKPTKEQLDAFRDRLTDLLLERFQDHWFPEKPSKGQGYRCIRLNESDKRDKIIDIAASHSGLNLHNLQLPSEVTIWVDPTEVCCRFGEHQGSFCTLATFKNGSDEIYLEEVNLDEMSRKAHELNEKVKQEMATRKNGRRSFITNGVSSPNFNAKTNRFNGYSGPYHHHHSLHIHHNHHNQHSHHHHHHHSNGHHGVGSHHHSNQQHHHHHSANSASVNVSGGGPGSLNNHHHSPSPAAISWYNSVNTPTTSNNNSNNNTTPMDTIFSSSSPPNMYNLAKFSPPKYGYGTASKWSTPPMHPYANNGFPSNKGDKYHWYNKPIKA